MLANMMVTIGIGHGPGLLVTVSTTYKRHEEFAEAQFIGVHPLIRQMFGYRPR